MIKTTFALLVTLLTTSALAVTIQYPNKKGYQFTDEERKTIQLIADTTEKEVRKLLPTLDDELVLQVRAGKFVIEETGELGGALSPGTVSWTVDSDRSEGVIAIINARLRHTLFHEFHHLVRGWLMVGGNPMTSFMDGVVSEGMATVFARDFSGCSAPWTEYPEDIDNWVEELKALPATGARYDHWMFRHPDGRKWIGYRAGSYLVDRAIKASNKSAADLILKPTGVILELAEAP